MGRGLRPHPIYTPFRYWWMLFSVDSTYFINWFCRPLFYIGLWTAYLNGEGEVTIMFLKLPKKILWFAMVLFIIAVSGGFAYYKSVYLPAQVPDELQIKTVTARQGEIVIFASGSDTLIAANEIELGFAVSGPIDQLFVQVGDKVQIGDKLAVEGNRNQLESASASDQLAVMTAQTQLDLANAREDLGKAEYTWTVQQEGNRASGNTIAAAEANLVLAQNDVDRAQKEYNKYSGRPEDDPPHALALTKLVDAKNKRDSIIRSLNWYKGAPDENAQALLDAKIATAQARVAELERKWDRVEEGPDPDEIAKAELKLASAKAKLAISQANLDQSFLLALMNGTIMEINAQVGQTVSGQFIRLADLS